MMRPSLEGTREGQEVGAGGDKDRMYNRNQTLEEELCTLRAFIPGITDDIRSIFKEAVTDSLWSMLPEREARALLRLIGETGFESPNDVYEGLDSVLRGGSQILKNAIREEFHASVHMLIEKVERGFAAGV